MSLFFLFLADGQWKQRMNTVVNIVLDQKVFIHMGMPKEFFLISTYFIKKKGGEGHIQNMWSNPFPKNTITKK